MGNSLNGKLSVLKRKASSFFFLLRHLREKLRDYVYGVDFVSSMSREKAGIDKLEGTVHYGSTGFAPELIDALKFLKIKPDDSILDYGSGKGAALVTFNRFPFRRILGIELSETLVSICRSNLKKLKLHGIEIVEGDATKFKEIDDFKLFYFANPFVGVIFKKVIDNIIVSATHNPRRINIIYYHPKCHDLIMDTGKFEIIQKFNYGARRLFIYQYLDNEYPL